LKATGRLYVASSITHIVGSFRMGGSGQLVSKGRFSHWYSGGLETGERQEREIMNEKCTMRHEPFGRPTKPIVKVFLTRPKRAARMNPSSSSAA
jgi:hypothetical protein